MLEAALPREPGAPPGRARCGPWAWCGAGAAPWGPGRPFSSSPGGASGREGSAFRVAPRAGQGQAPPSRLHNPSIRYLPGWLPTREGEPRGDRAATPKTCWAGTAATCQSRGTMCRTPDRSQPQHQASQGSGLLGHGDAAAAASGERGRRGCMGTWHDPSRLRLSLCRLSRHSELEWSLQPGLLMPRVQDELWPADSGCGLAAAAARLTPAPATCSLASAPQLKGPPGSLGRRPPQGSSAPPRQLWELLVPGCGLIPWPLPSSPPPAAPGMWPGPAGSAGWVSGRWGVHCQHALAVRLVLCAMMVLGVV